MEWKGVVGRSGLVKRLKTLIRADVEQKEAWNSDMWNRREEIGKNMEQKKQESIY